MPAGIYISEVTSGGAAENAGLKSGYVLTSFDGHSITSTSELKSLLQYYSAGETVEVEVQVPDNGSYETKTFSLTLGTSTSSSDAQQSDSQQNAGSSRSAEGGNTLTSATRESGQADRRSSGGPGISSRCRAGGTRILRGIARLSI